LTILLPAVIFAAAIMKRRTRVIFPALLLMLFVTKATGQIVIEENPKAGLVEDQSEITRKDNMDEKIRKNFFLRAEVSKSKCYVGEPVMAVFKAYSRLEANSQVLRRPSLTGFSVVEMVDAYSSMPDVEKLDGKYYNVHLIRKVQLFPLQPGHFELEPAEVESIIHFRHPPPRARNINDFLRDRSKDLVDDSLLNRKIISLTPGISIDVLPLPDTVMTVPFTGAIGNFAISLESQQRSWRQNEPANIKLVLTGTGNFPLITPPDIKWPKGINPPDPMVSESTNRYVFPLSGTKIFNYSIDSKDTGTFEIPPVSFSYFDPGSAGYKTARSAAFVFKITRAPFWKRIRPLQQIAEAESIPRQWYYFGIVALVIIAWIMFQVVRSLKKKVSVVSMPVPEPVKPPVDEVVFFEDQIYPARKAMASGDHKQFYYQVKQTAYDVIAHKFKVPASGLSKQSIRFLLKQDSADEADVNELIRLLDSSELALYTPHTGSEDMEEAFRKLEDVLKKLTSPRA
jgi:BatD DUF11 like domain